VASVEHPTRLRKLLRRGRHRMGLSSRLDVERWTLGAVIELFRFTRPSPAWQTRLSASRGKKMLQFSACHP
jgi:hypothetical protein